MACPIITYGIEYTGGTTTTVNFTGDCTGNTIIDAVGYLYVSSSSIPTGSDLSITASTSGCQKIWFVDQCSGEIFWMYNNNTFFDGFGYTFENLLINCQSVPPGADTEFIGGCFSATTTDPGGFQRQIDGVKTITPSSSPTPIEPCLLKNCGVGNNKCSTYIVESNNPNPQTIQYSTSLCCSSVSCLYSLEINSGETWSINVYGNHIYDTSGLTITFDAQTSFLLGFSSVCSDITFTISLSRNPNGLGGESIQNYLGDVFCFEEVLGCNNLPTLSGCYQLVTLNADNPTEFPTETNCYHSFRLKDSYVDAAACTADCPCGYPPTSCQGCDPTLSWSGFNEECCITITDSIPPTAPTPGTEWTWDSITPQSVYGEYGTKFYNPGYSQTWVFGQQGLNAGEYNPLLTTPNVWGSGTTTPISPLNRSGIWTTSQSGTWQPNGVWLGFSVCLTVAESKTYYFGVGWDNFIRVAIDGTLIIQGLNINANYFRYWNVYPIYLQQGNHTFTFEVQNDTLSAVIGWELYNTDFTTLTTATNISQLDILYSSSAYTGQQVQYIKNLNESFNPSGFTCPDGFTYSDCDGQCVQFELCCPEPPQPISCEFSGYCINGTDTLFDDYYVSAGLDTTGLSYYTGQTNNLFIYFNRDRNQWCLSDSLGGDCYLFGRTNCVTECPDFCDEFFSQGSCPSTTTTTTINCSTFDFAALFDCEVFPTTTTTTSTSTTTTTTLPPPDPCSATSVNATLNFYTTTTTTYSPSTTTTTTINYSCNFSGDVNFNVIEVEIKCPISKEFKDCYDMGGTRYYTNDILTNPGGGDVEVDMVFSALVNGSLKCISYVGINNDVSPIHNIELVGGDFGLYPSGCSVCNESTTTTTTIPPTTTTTTTTTIPCYCYTLASSKSTQFSFVDCGGTARTTGVTIESIVTICSQNPPEDPPVPDNELGTATIGGSCTPSSICSLPPCRCYRVTNTTGRPGSGIPVNFLIVNCNTNLSNVISTLGGSDDYFCSRIHPISFASGLTIVPNNNNCVNGVCG